MYRLPCETARKKLLATVLETVEIRPWSSKGLFLALELHLQSHLKHKCKKMGQKANVSGTAKIQKILISSWIKYGFISYIKACMPEEGREQIWLKIWIHHVDTPPCANLWSNRGNLWGLTAYYNFCLITMCMWFREATATPISTHTTGII